MRLKKLKEHLKTQLPYKRTQRVGEQIHKILSDIAIKYIDLSSFGFVTLTNVNISPDFQFAKIYFSVYQPKKETNEIETGLNNLTKAFKKYLAPQLHLRVTPDPQFIYDETLEYSEKIEELIKSIKDKEKNDN